MRRTRLAVVVLAVVALAATVWYLSADSVALWSMTPLALTVLVVPLVTWLPERAFTRIAIAWAVGGVLGAYAFGVSVALAAAILGAALVAHRCLRYRAQR
jgi:hypothetical protein